MSRPQFPDVLGRRDLMNPGATAHKAGPTIEDRVAALERGAMSRPTTKAGIPSDADYVSPPPINTMVVDTTNSRLYIRTAIGTWKYAALT